MAVKRDLNERRDDKDRWNRQEALLRFISYYQFNINQADYWKDLWGMYINLQGLLDLLETDFLEKGTNSEGVKINIRGFKTKKFFDYRLLLDQGNSLAEKSKDSTLEIDIRKHLGTNAYKKFQKVKYLLYQEVEIQGFNARVTNITDAYRDGNQ